MALKIRTGQLDQLRRHGEETYPLECCGVLVGHVGSDGVRIVDRVVRCSNAAAATRERHYAISPRELVRVQREARRAGASVVGFYHSHPDYPARWSSTDLAQAHWTGCSYVVVAVESGRAVEARSFLLRGGACQPGFEDEAIDICEF